MKKHLFYAWVEQIKKYVLKKGLFQFTNFLERMCKKIGPFLERGIGFREFFLERGGANLECRAAHTQPKNTQVSPSPLGISVTDENPLTHAEM